MYIRRKVFSTFIDTETGEERLFSTTEVDGMKVKEFARRDYEGLNNEEKKLLKKERQAYAKDLKKPWKM